MDNSRKDHGNLKDRTGDRYGKLVVLERDRSRMKPVKWICRCDCGNVSSVDAGKLGSGHTRSCGCMIGESNKAAIEDLSGRSFGRLTVLGPVEVGVHTRWKCACACGGEKVVSRTYLLLTSKEPSCGCASAEKAAARRFRDLTGLRFGRLMVAEFLRFDQSRKSIWRCACDCGGSKDVRGNTLVSGLTISCGCAHGARLGLMPDATRQRLSLKCAKRRARLKDASGDGWTQADVDEVFRLQRGLCAGPGCGVPLGDGFHRDHRTPLALGGRHDRDNLELLCADCNHRKNATDPIAWAQKNGKLL